MSFSAVNSGWAQWPQVPEVAYLSLSESCCCLETPQAMAGEEEVTLLRVFSYCRLPGELEGRKRMGVEKCPLSLFSAPHEACGKSKAFLPAAAYFLTGSLCQDCCQL